MAIARLRGPGPLAPALAADHNAVCHREAMTAIRSASVWTQVASTRGDTALAGAHAQGAELAVQGRSLHADEFSGA